MKQIIVMEPLGVSEELLQSLAEPFKAQGYELVVHTMKETDQVKLLDRVREASIIILANQPLPGDIIRQCPNLEFISVAFTGVDHVDLEACREKGIIVSNAAGYSTQAVTELVFGLAISVLAMYYLAIAVHGQEVPKMDYLDLNCMEKPLVSWELAQSVVQWHALQKHLGARSSPITVQKNLN